MFFICKKILHWPQWLAAITVSLAVFVTGMASGWTSPYIAQLTSPNTTLTLTLTTSEASWVVSFLGLGRFIGVVLGAISQGLIGRKKTLLISGLPLASGWICIMVATDVPTLYAARLLCGLASGAIWSALTLYLGEIADPKIRGSLIFLNLNTSSMGSFMGNAMGSYLPMEQFSCVTLVATGLFMLLFSFIPETPYQHMINGDSIKAEKSLRWFNREVDVKRELLELQDYVGSTEVSVASRIEELKKPINRKNMALLTCLNVFLYLAGHNTIGFYAEIIVTKSQIDLVPSTVVMALSFSSIVAGSTATIVIDKFGRRQLLIGSSIGGTVALLMLGIHFHMLTSGYVTVTWLPIAALFLFNFSFAYGLVPVPYALTGELFPPIIKIIASMNFSATSALLSFLASKAFQPFLDLVGEKYVFWTFAVSAMTSGVFSYFFVPETKGKSLVEIQDFMKRNSHEDQNKTKHASDMKVRVDA